MGPHLREHGSDKRPVETLGQKNDDRRVVLHQRLKHNPEVRRRPWYRHTSGCWISQETSIVQAACLTRRTTICFFATNAYPIQENAFFVTLTSNVSWLRWCCTHVGYLLCTGRHESGPTVKHMCRRAVSVDGMFLFLPGRICTLTRRQTQTTHRRFGP